MRSPLFACLLSLTLCGSCFALDWKAFDDPTAVVLTEPLAKTIAELPAAEKAAAVKRLHDSLKADHIEIRRRAALTLGSLGDKTGVPVMIADLPTAGDQDKPNIAVALRILKDDRAVPALQTALKDRVIMVRCIAASALGEMKAAKAYDDLVALTRDKETKPPKKGELNCIIMLPAQSACYALGALGEKKAVPVLIDLLTDPDLRNAAKQGLESLTGEKFGEDAEKWRAWWKSQPREDEKGDKR